MGFFNWPGTTRFISPHTIPKSQPAFCRRIFFQLALVLSRRRHRLIFAFAVEVKLSSLNLQLQSFRWLTLMINFPSSPLRSLFHKIKIPNLAVFLDFSVDWCILLTQTTHHTRKRIFANFQRLSAYTPDSISFIILIYCVAQNCFMHLFVLFLFLSNQMVTRAHAIDILTSFICKFKYHSFIFVLFFFFIISIEFRLLKHLNLNDCVDIFVIDAWNLTNFFMYLKCSIKYGCESYEVLLSSYIFCLSFIKSLFLHPWVEIASVL